MTAARALYRLEGIEPDNLLAFMALLGLLRALDADDRERTPADRVNARAGWDIDAPPLRPRLSLALDVTQAEVTERAAAGLRPSPALTISAAERTSATRGPIAAIFSRRRQEPHPAPSGIGPTCSRH
jgi:hypothetical protein